MIPGTHPILSCDEAKRLETNLFGGDEAGEWNAMRRAGGAIGLAVLRDSQEIGGIPSNSRVLVLVGKGHNGGDALIAAETILEARGEARADIGFVFGERPLRSLVVRAWQALVHRFGERVSLVTPARLAPSYDLCLDGIFGFQFRPPVEARVRDFIERVNALPIRFRAAVDLPSGGLFRADFTYATGSVKSTALEGDAAGRVRYLDLGFFSEGAVGAQRVLTSAILAPLAGFRSPHSDKRSHGHLFVLGGSRSYPGAVMMAVLAALRSGVGLVTAFVPESLVPAYAARVPEAMWVGWPETPDGGLALEGLHLIRDRMERATAFVIGPGMAREPETLALAATLAKIASVPVLLDADALQPAIIREAKSPLVVTPHAGEFARIAEKATIEEFAKTTGAVVVLKGPVTRVAGDAEKGEAGGTTYYSLFGGPVLARGGSGDLLAGLIGGLLAQNPADPLLAAARGTVWHGLAADLLARARGQVAVNTTQLVDFLSPALREL